jgi:hypothetical protein
VNFQIPDIYLWTKFYDLMALKTKKTQLWSCSWQWLTYLCKVRQKRPWRRGHRVRLQGRRSQGVRLLGMYLLLCCRHNLCNMHCHCVYLRKQEQAFALWLSEAWKW